MGLEFFTGFEGCANFADCEALFDAFSGSIDYSATGGYNNSKRIGSGGFDRHVRKNLITPRKTVVAGAHIINVGYYNSNDINYNILTIGGADIRIINWAENDLRIYRSTTLLASGLPHIPYGMTHVEVKLFSDATAGTLQIKINGVMAAEHNLSGLNTGGQDITSVAWSTFSRILDNLFISDDWEGELVSVLLVPTSDDSVQFTPSTGTDNYAMVDETGEDGDSTYVYSGTVGHKDVYGFSDVPAGYAVKGVSVVTTARKSDSGVRTLQVIANQDSVDYDLGSELILTTTYPSGLSVNHQRCLDKAPDGTSWDVNKLNAVKWGFEIAS